MCFANKTGQFWCDAYHLISTAPTPFPPTVPFYLHRQRANQIKMALHSFQRSDWNVRIELAYDYLFVGGLKQAGKLLKRLYHGHGIYGIKKYHDLDPILGPRWHVRVLNKQMDFCYVILGTGQFHLHRRQSTYTWFSAWPRSSRWVIQLCLLLYKEMVFKDNGKTSFK